MVGVLVILVGCQSEDSSTEDTDASSESQTETTEAEQETKDKDEHDHDHDHDHDEHEHEHHHAHDEETEEIYNGYFEDSQVQDRTLSDWEGDWQSVYPYLQDGTLDEVFTHKAEHEGGQNSGRI